MRLAGFEPATNGLEGRRSSTELQARARKRSAGENPINAAVADMPCSLALRLDQALVPGPTDAPGHESAGAVLQRRYGSEVEGSTWWQA